MEETGLIPQERSSQSSTARRPIQYVRAINRLAYERLLPATVFCLFASEQIFLVIHHLNEGEWLLAMRSVIILAFNLLIVMLFILRHPHIGERAQLAGALVAMAGTLMPTMLSVQPVRYPGLLLAGNVLVMVGTAWAIFSLAALGRCMGVFPEVRGLVTRGPYRVVRHPLYLGELVANFGILLPAASIFSVILGITWVFLQLWRARNEERALIKIFPEYEGYKSRTFGFIPFIW